MATWFVNFFRKIAAEEIKEAWRRRKDCLKRNPNPQVRKFEFYSRLFNSEAEDYSKMIPLDQLSSRQKTVPPLIIGLIKGMGIDEVVRLIIEGSLPVLDVACHSQAVERNVKLTSEACQYAIGKNNQLAFAINKQDSCDKLKTVAKIQDFRNFR